MLKLHAFVALFAAIGAANAHGINPRHAHLKRQDTTASSSATAAPSGSVSASASATASPASPSAPAGSQPAGGLASLSASRTDIPPLSEISSGMPTGTTYAATTTVQPGTVPTIADLDNAPAIPGFVFQMGEWPAQDKVPPTDSDEVKTWLKELEGFNIPDLEPTTDGYCASDPEFSGDAENRGWWTCGGWTRDTDILACPDKLTWGVSFDDGPGPYTVKLLDYLDEKDISATFFVVGSRVIERPDILKQEYTSGHEISVHSWSHSHLTKLTTEEIVAELGWTRRAIKEVLGVTPTTMRPPYGDIDDRVRAISLAMGMIPILWTKGPSGTFDTNDWSVPAGNVDGVESIQKFSAILGDAAGLDTGFIVLQHDLYEITVDLSIGYSLELAQSHNPPFTLLPIGQCAQIPTNDLYRETNTNSSFPSTEIDVAGDGSIVSDAAVGDSNGAMLLQLPSFVLGLAGFATLLCLL